MAIYHLSVKPVSRGTGRRATAAAAYRAAARIEDQELGLVYDYSRKHGIEHAEVVLSASAAKQQIQRARDRQQLWNAAEGAERPKDARVAREYEIALPVELTRKKRLELTREFSQAIANRYNNAVDFAIHKPHWNGDGRNYHAHVLATTREVTPTGLGEKTAAELSDADRRKRELPSASVEFKEIRALWAALTNEYRMSLGLRTRVDHRSLKDQGVEREPTSHLGPSVHAMLRRGADSHVLERIRGEHLEAARERLERSAELGRLGREGESLNRSVLTLESDVRIAVAQRDAQRRDAPVRSLSAEPVLDGEAVRRAAQDHWLAEKEALQREDRGRSRDGEDLIITL